MRCPLVPSRCRAMDVGLSGVGGAAATWQWWGPGERWRGRVKRERKERMEREGGGGRETVLSLGVQQMPCSGRWPLWGRPGSSDMAVVGTRREREREERRTKS